MPHNISHLSFLHNKKRNKAKFAPTWLPVLGSIPVDNNRQNHSRTASPPLALLLASSELTLSASATGSGRVRSS